MHQKKKQTFSSFTRTRSGFTLAEMILVVALTLFLLTVTVQGFVNSASQFSFSNAAQKVEEMIRTARSYAISGKAQLDYTDFDKDGCKDVASGACAVDYVTPAHYGVNFKKTTTTGVDSYTVTLFADNHEVVGKAPKEGVFEDTSTDYGDGFDIILERFPVPSGMQLIIPGAGNSATIFFSPVFADVSTDFTITAADPFFRYGVTQKAGDITRKRCSQTHILAGISEPIQTLTSSPTSCP
jgi:type II secretory pathway pseudopilin PulG